MEIPAQDFFGSTHQVHIDALIDFCPICRTHVEGKPIGAFLDGAGDRSGTLQIVYRCPRNRCGKIFLVFYEGVLQYRSSRCRYFMHQAVPLTPEAPAVPEAVAALSPSFMKIYSQTWHADEVGLHEISGPGFRKALECLVKDFAKSRPGADEQAIGGSRLGSCIEKYIDDEKTKQVAKRAVWLGNDETHYERKWTDKDIRDLKNLLRMTINAIDNQLMAERYEEEMKETKEGKH